VADNADEASKVTFGSGFDRITDMKQVLMAYYMFSHMIVEGSIKLRYRKIASSMAPIQNGSVCSP
jgi:hypothetical protein